MGIIYRITNKVTGKSYIGQTVQTLNKRWNGHLSDARRNKSKCHFGNALRLYPRDNWSVELICEAEETDLDRLEQKFIALYDTYNNGYNSTIGGEGTRGKSLSEAHKRKLSDAHKGKTSWNKGITPNDSTRQKISKSLKGKKLSAAHAEKVKMNLKPGSAAYAGWNKGIGKPISKVDINGTVIESYATVKEAAIKNQIQPTNIVRAAKQKKKMKGYYWIYANYMH